MPRKARIDAPGALHHVIVRGIERKKIFRSDSDRNNFVNRLAELIPETQTDHLYTPPGATIKRLMPWIW